MTVGDSIGLVKQLQSLLEAVHRLQRGLRQLTYLGVLELSCGIDGGGQESGCLAATLHAVRQL